MPQATGPTLPTPRDAALAVVRTLQRHGHVAYFAGGCVRDALLGRTPKDYDVATDAPPDRVHAHFHGSKYVGEAFGVVRVYSHGSAIEVATFRKEWGYDDGRRPSRVEFTDARHDAQRRDFTINGLFENPLAGTPGETIIDYVGGRKDLADGVIRAIGEPEHRLAEDYLRMLRAVRFAARFGFQIEEHTARSIRQFSAHLGQISRERIGQEIAWMLTPPGSSGSSGSSGGQRTATGAIGRAARLIQSLRLDGPSLIEDHGEPDLPTVDSLEHSADAHADYAAMLAAWLLDRYAGKPADNTAQIVACWRRALCLSNETTDALAATLQLAAAAEPWPSLTVAQQKRLLAQDRWPAAHALLRAASHRPAGRELLQSIDRSAPDMLAQGVKPTPLVTGADLIALGRSPGPDFRRLLDAVYDAQLQGQVVTREEALAFLKAQS